MKSVKTLYPGQSGTKKWVALYGVRYRHDQKSGKRYTMVEVIVDEAVLKKKKAQPPGNKLVMIRVYQHERYVQKMIKSVGACWNPQCGLWGRYRIGRLSLWVWKAGWNRKVVMLSDVLYREFIYTL